MSPLATLTLTPILPSVGPVFFMKKDFGAYGDGANDDTAAIGAGLEAVKATGKGTLVFEPGTYLYTNIDKTLDNLTIIGYNRAILRSSLALTSVTTCFVLRGSNITIDNMEFDSTFTINLDSDFASRAAPSGTLRVISLDAQTAFMTDTVIKNCTIRDSRNTPINVTNGERVHILNNKMQRALGNGIWVSDIKRDLLIQGNFIQYTGDDGIAVLSDSFWSTGTERVIIDNNTVQNSYANGIDLGGTAGAIVSNNHIDSTWASGIVAYEFTGTGPTKPDFDVNIHDNYVVNAGQYFGASQAKTAAQPGQQDVGISVYTTNNLRVSVRNNEVRNSHLHGIYTQIAAVGQVIGNTVYNAGGGGIACLNMSGGQISNNRSESAGTHGIALVTCNDTVVNGNVSMNADVVNDGTSDGINISGCNRLAMNGNLVLGTQIDKSYEFVGTCADISFFGNRYPSAKLPTLTGTVTNFLQEPFATSGAPTSTKYASGQQAWDAATFKLYSYTGSAWKSVTMA